MDKPTRTKFIKECIERDHEAQYTNMRLMYPEHKLKPWEELTEEEREKVRAVNRDYTAFMQQLGAQISGGNKNG